MEWRQRGKDRFETSWNGETWYLSATPKADKPWLLSSKIVNGRKARVQEIGSPDPETARSQAELWLSLSGLNAA